MTPDLVGGNVPSSLPYTLSVMGRSWAAPLLLLSQAHVTLSTYMTHVFVYGTLKNSQPNHFQMMDENNGKAMFCGRAHTVERFPLVIAGKYNIPFLLNVPGEGHQVKGEVYCVDSRMLRFLDIFEGCPHMYQRTLLDLEVKDWVGEIGTCGTELAAGNHTKAFMYSTTTYEPQWLTLPYQESYDAYGDHGLAYVARENRN